MQLTDLRICHAVELQDYHISVVESEKVWHHFYHSYVGESPQLWIFRNLINIKIIRKKGGSSSPNTLLQYLKISGDV